MLREALLATFLQKWLREGTKPVARSQKVLLEVETYLMVLTGTKYVVRSHDVRETNFVFSQRPYKMVFTIHPVVMPKPAARKKTHRGL